MLSMNNKPTLLKIADEVKTFPSLSMPPAIPSELSKMSLTRKVRNTKVCLENLDYYKA